MNVQNNSQSITRRSDLKGTLVVDGRKKQVIQPQTNLSVFGVKDTTAGDYGPVAVALDIKPGYDNQEIDIYGAGGLTPFVVRLRKNDGTWSPLTIAAGSRVRCVYTKVKGWFSYVQTTITNDG